MGRFTSISLGMILLLVSVSPLIGSGVVEIPQESPEMVWMKVNEYTVEYQILPGEEEGFMLDGRTGTIPSVGPHIGLTSKAWAALDIVPEWLRYDLQLKFRILDFDMADALADQIIASEGNETMDEIAFVAAHLSTQTINNEYFFPEIITHNAELIYSQEDLVPYATIVEKEDYTTIVYNTTEGELELPRDIYYWFVVHPDLGDEVPTYVDPDYNYAEDQPRDRDYGTPPPTGKFWREWFFVNNKSGQPLLPDLLNDTYTFMDGIRAVNSWISQSMTFTSDNERPNQPVRIYEKGIGRCGEYQDMRSSAGRAALLPIVPTSNSAEDHVWNEFWLGEWIHWDGMINNPRAYENGWGKTLSTVWNQRGDGFTWDVTDTYTDVSTINVTVLDQAGLPADGTLVELKTEMFYMEDLKTTTNFLTTDHRGQVEFMVGDERNYWGTADGGDLGKDPLNPNIAPTEIVMNTSVGEEYDFQFDLPFPASSPNHLSTTGFDPTVPADYTANITYEVMDRTVRGRNSFTGDTFEDRKPGGDITAIVIDQINVQSYSMNGPFNSLYYSERSGGDSFSVPLDMNEPYSVFFTNDFSQATVKRVNVTIEIWGFVSSNIFNVQESYEISEQMVIEGNANFVESVDSVMTMIEGETDWSDAYLEYFRSDWVNWTSITDLDGIEPGEYRFWSMSTGDQGKVHYSSSLINIIDQSGPSITITNMPPGPYRDTDILTVSGTANDHHMVEELYFYYDGISSTKSRISLENGEWSVNIDLATVGYGSHSITFEAVDPSENVASRRVDLDIIEGQEPYVFVDSPKTGSIFAQGDLIEIEGQAKDNVKVYELILLVDDREIADMTSSIDSTGYFSFVWDTGSIQVSDGEHVVEVLAIDPSDNEYGFDISIILDGEGPEIEVLSGLPDVIGPLSRFKIEGTVSDDTGLEMMEWSYDATKWEDVTADVRGGEFSLDIDGITSGSSGDVDVILKAYDIVGNVNEEKISFFLDMDGPEIDLSSIPSIILKGDDIKLSGTVDDDSGLEKTTVVVDGLGQIDEMMDEGPLNIDTEIPSSDLGAGDVSIRVISTDSVSNLNEEILETRIVTLTTDTDRDGIPDIWEYENGFDPDTADSGDDPDGDGYTNLQEYLGKDGVRGTEDYTDPHDVNSYPEKEEEGSNLFSILLMITVITLIVAFVLFFIIKISKKS